MNTQESIKVKTPLDLISEVERNQNLLLVNDRLFCLHSGTWIVSELFDGGFIANHTDGETELFFFSELQKGWEFHDSTKRNNSINYRIKYA